MKKEKKTLKDAPRGVQITIGILTLALLAILMNVCIRGCEDAPVADMNVNWDTLNYDQRKAWIETYLEANEYNYDIYNQVDQAISSRFNFPETVDYDLRPSLRNAYITDADSGWVFVSGSGTAKNAFGVPTNFSYQVRFVFTSEVQRIDKITVN